RRVGDVTEADQARGLLQETLGGMRTGSENGGGRGEAALAIRARKLVGPDDEFNRLGTHGEVPHGVGFRAAMDGITTAVTVRADAHTGCGNEGQAHGVRRSVV